MHVYRPTPPLTNRAPWKPWCNSNTVQAYTWYFDALSVSCWLAPIVTWQSTQIGHVLLISFFIFCSQLILAFWIRAILSFLLFCLALTIYIFVTKMSFVVAPPAGFMLCHNYLFNYWTGSPSTAHATAINFSCWFKAWVSFSIITRGLYNQPWLFPPTAIVTSLGFFKLWV